MSIYESGLLIPHFYVVRSFYLGAPTHTHIHTHRCIEPHYVHKTYVNETEAIIPFPQWSLILSPSYPEHPFITSACVLDPAQGPSAARLARPCVVTSDSFPPGKSPELQVPEARQNAIYKAAGQDTTVSV